MLAHADARPSRLSPCVGRRTIAWLCCEEESSYVAGANVRVAGGRPPGTTLG